MNVMFPFVIDLAFHMNSLDLHSISIQLKIIAQLGQIIAKGD